MDLLVILFMLATFMAIWRRLHQKYVELNFSYRVYQMRDQLRRYAIEGKVDSNEWAFYFMDKSFSNSINEAYYITLFHVIVSTLKNTDDNKVNAYVSKLESELKKHPELKELMSAFMFEIKRYVAHQHYISYNVIFKPCMHALVGASTSTKQFSKAVMSALYEAVENKDLRRAA